MTEQPQSIGLDDLQVISTIIAAGAQRGMYRAEELATVGLVYQKINAILTAAGAIPNDTESNDTPENESEGEANA